LEIVDNLQDQITAFDAELDVAKTDAPLPVFDESLVPVIENSSTYIEEPGTPAYHKYLESFDLDVHLPEIGLFCEKSANLRRIHSRLVPTAIQERTFWCRLFFRIEQKQQAKKMSQHLIDHLKMDEENVEDVELTAEELEELEKLENEGDFGSEGSWKGWDENS
jgi:hypothetical protein